VMLYVVTGPPAAGKSTWVRAHARPGDVVVDYDLIAGALTVAGTDGTSYDHRGPVRACAFRARAAVIREALCHLDKIDVYIIHAMPSADALARYAEHDAHMVTVDPGKDVVMARIAEQRPHAARAVATRWYAQAGQRQGAPPPPTTRVGGPGATVQAAPPRTSRSW
jgi:AAA domain-containing protein